jgi:hypothetical protein
MAAAAGLFNDAIRSGFLPVPAGSGAAPVGYAVLGQPAALWAPTAS